MLAVSMTCWYRDYISHYYDDAIADQQAEAARVAAFGERANQRAIRNVRAAIGR